MSVLLTKFNEAARNEAGESLKYWGDFELSAMAEEAESNGSGGFGLIEVPFGVLEAYQSWGNYYQCECAEIRAKVNAGTVVDAFEQADVIHGEYKGMIWFDASNPKGVKLAEEFSAAMHDYPFLDEEWLSELEWENAVEYVAQTVSLPDGVEPEDVLRKMGEIPHCSNCSYIGATDMLDALDELGWKECAAEGCDEFLRCATDGAVCYECAEDISVNPECDHAFLVIDPLKHMGLYPTVKEITDSDKACGDCYGLVYPYARNLVAV